MTNYALLSPPAGCHRLGDLQGRAFLRALERHVFEEVRDAGLIGGFVARACAHPYADGSRGKPGHVFCDDAKPVAEGMCLRAQISDLMWRGVP